MRDPLLTVAKQYAGMSLAVAPTALAPGDEVVCTLTSPLQPPPVHPLLFLEVGAWHQEAGPPIATEPVTTYTRIVLHLPSDIPVGIYRISLRLHEWILQSKPIQIAPHDQLAIANQLTDAYTQLEESRDALEDGHFDLFWAGASRAAAILEDRGDWQASARTWSEIADSAFRARRYVPSIASALRAQRAFELASLPADAALKLEFARRATLFADNEERHPSREPRGLSGHLVDYVLRSSSSVADLRKDLFVLNNDLHAEHLILPEEVLNATFSHLASFALDRAALERLLLAITNFPSLGGLSLALSLAEDHTGSSADPEVLQCCLECIFDLSRYFRQLVRLSPDDAKPLVDDRRRLLLRLLEHPIHSPLAFHLLLQSTDEEDAFELLLEGVLRGLDPNAALDQVGQSMGQVVSSRFRLGLHAVALEGHHPVASLVRGTLLFEPDQLATEIEVVRELGGSKQRWQELILAETDHE